MKYRRYIRYIVYITINLYKVGLGTPLRTVECL